MCARDSCGTFLCCVCPVCVGALFLMAASSSDADWAWNPPPPPPPRPLQPFHTTSSGGGDDLGDVLRQIVFLFLLIVCQNPAAFIPSLCQSLFRCLEALRQCQQQCVRLLESCVGTLSGEEDEYVQTTRMYSRLQDRQPQGPPHPPPLPSRLPAPSGAARLHPKLARFQQRLDAFTAAQPRQDQPRLEATVQGML